MNDVLTFLNKVHDVAEALSCSTNESGIEYAGQIIDYLHSYPHTMSDFMERGAESLLDPTNMPMFLRPHNLSFRCAKGKVKHPDEVIPLLDKQDGE